MKYIFLFCLIFEQSAFALETNFHSQSTVVSQNHTPFASPYEGANSLSGHAESATSITWTLYGGLRLAKNLELYVNPELAGGSGFSRTRGVAGFPNAEIYRVDDPSPKWNLARLFLRKDFAFGDETEKVADGPNQLSRELPRRRLTVIAGRFSLNDYFDANSVAHDPRTQFLNWSFMDNGAWDYAADTRGYSWGALIEYNAADWAVRFASVMLPETANGLRFDRDFPDKRGDNLEFEYCGWESHILRVLAFSNRADMGSYRQTIDTPAYGMDLKPSRRARTKIGFGVNEEYQLNADLGVFARASWNDGRSETWAFTEIDRALSFGSSLRGTKWNRAHDQAGLALALNELSGDHRDFLAAGGYGFVVGDGRINYSPEEIAEVFYRLQATDALQVSLDYQFIAHPGYNADRGPVSAGAIRLHYEL